MRDEIRFTAPCSLPLKIINMVALVVLPLPIVAGTLLFILHGEVLRD